MNIRVYLNLTFSVEQIFHVILHYSFVQVLLHIARNKIFISE